jgi:hypothetical protein
MAESSWPTWEVMQEHLENLTSQGYMTMVEIATCHMPEDPASPSPSGGYVMVCHHIDFSTPCCGPIADNNIT